MNFENWANVSSSSQQESGQGALQSEYVSSLYDFKQRTQKQDVYGTNEKVEVQDSESKQKKIDSIEEEYGVSVEEKNGAYEYSLRANGKDTVIATSKDLSKESLDQAEPQLQKAVSTEKQRLEGRYNIRFADSTDSLKNFDDKGNRKDVKAREPRLDELASLQSALKHSEPANLASDRSKKLLVFFAAEDTGPKARFDPEHNGNPYEPTGQPALYLFPKSKGLPATEADKALLPPGSAGNNVSLEWILTHELSHHSLDKNGGKQGTDNPAAEIERANEMGWVPGKDDAGVPIWYIKGKDGFNYMPDVDYEKQSLVYRRKTSDGQYADQNGKPTTKELSYTLTQEQMRETAAVRTVTAKVEAHWSEPYAEALTAFRINSDQRKRLQQENLNLYDLIRKRDQEDIDKAYGRSPDGKSRMIRLPNGELGPNTARNRETVIEFEKK